MCKDLAPLVQFLADFCGLIVVAVVYLFRREQTIHYTHYTKITITKAGNQKGNVHAGHLWHKQKNNYLTIC